MRSTLDAALNHLAQDGVIAIQEAELAKLTCVRGALWVTADHNKINVILRDGDTHTLKHNELTLAIALEPTDYHLHTVSGAVAPSIKALWQRGISAFQKRFAES